MINLLANNNIYNSKELQEFLIDLENKYTIENAQEKYKNLVNFSTNAKEPFHNWFIYREGFSSELIKELISMSGISKDEYVIDPFSGSGTTNVVAALSGYNTLGLDINPMSAFIANAKITHYSSKDICKAIKLSNSIERNYSINLTYNINEIQKYFNNEIYTDLLRIKIFIDLLEESKAKTILKVAFISIICDCSNRKRDGNGLKVRPTKVTNTFEYFTNKVKVITNDLLNTTARSNISANVLSDTATSLHSNFSSIAQSRKAGTIIFSPPYANSFDYFESYKLELIMGGFANGFDGINQLRKKAIRSFIGGDKQPTCDKYIDLIAEEIENEIPNKERLTQKKDNRTRKVPNMIKGYFADMHEVIKQCSLCLEKGKTTYIVVDQSAYVGKIVPTDLLLAYLAESEDFEVGKIIECRKARTSTQQLNNYPYLKNSLRESIVELIKK